MSCSVSGCSSPRGAVADLQVLDPERLGLGIDPPPGSASPGRTWLSCVANDSPLPGAVADFQRLDQERLSPAHWPCQRYSLARLTMHMMVSDVPPPGRGGAFQASTKSRSAWCVCLASVEQGQVVHGTQGVGVILPQGAAADFQRLDPRAARPPPVCLGLLYSTARSSMAFSVSGRPSPSTRRRPSRLLRSSRSASTGLPPSSSAWPSPARHGVERLRSLRALLPRIDSQRGGGLVRGTRPRPRGHGRYR